MTIKLRFTSIDMKTQDFTQDSDYFESYLLARKEFKKIINNFDPVEFKSNFDQLFFDKKNFKLFLKNSDGIVCGALGYVHMEKVFMDIFFWNHDLCEYNMHTVRRFFEEFFSKTQEMGIKEAVLPLDTNRKKFLPFKNHNQIFFRSTEEAKPTDPNIRNQYNHHYLVTVNYKNYFSQKNFFV